jgi:hypothetical protein
MRFVVKRGAKKGRGLTAVCWAILSAALVAGQTSRPINAPTNTQSKAAPKTASMSGCIDEDNGRYILVDDRELKPIADLVADGFPTEGFARHMGHKVIVRGISSPGDSRPLFKVRSIETISETCAPQQ